MTWGRSITLPDHQEEPKVTVTTDNAEVVCVVVAMKGKTYAGSAKRHPKDLFDFGIGYNLALSRAFELAALGCKEVASSRGHALGIGEVIEEFARAQDQEARRSSR